MRQVGEIVPYCTKEEWMDEGDGNTRVCVAVPRVLG